MIKSTDDNNSHPLGLDGWLAPLLAFTLWSLSLCLGIIDLFAIWETIVFFTSSSTAPLVTWRDPIFFFLAVILAVFAFNSARFHLAHFKQPRSWRFFALTIGIELLILTIPVMIYFLSN